MDFDDFEFDLTEVIFTLGFWLVVVVSVWILPARFGWPEYSFKMKLMVSIFMLPLTYYIVNKMNNQ